MLGSRLQPQSLAFHTSSFMHTRVLVTAILSARASLRAHTFFHLPSTQFLCKTQDNPTVSSSGMLLLSDGDWRTFQEMVNCKKALAVVIRNFGTSMRGVGKNS